MTLVKIGPHWVNPAHVTNVSPNEYEGVEWTEIDMVTGTGIKFGDLRPDGSRDEDYISVDEAAALLCAGDALPDR